MITPHYKRLFKPYMGSGSTIEKMIGWLRKTSGAPDEIISLAVRSLFTELGRGKTFPTDMCQCGCEIKAAHAAIDHYLLKETLKLKDEANKHYWEVLEKIDHERILEYIERGKEPGRVKKMFLKLTGGEIDADDTMPLGM